ncbi:MAG: hypothetical protein WA384_17270 [Rhodomicrobium sp.]
MEGPSETSGAERLISPVETLQNAEGTSYGFSVLDEESMTPCFRLAFDTREDADQGRTMMVQIIEHCLFYEVPDDSAQSGTKPAWGSSWR